MYTQSVFVKPASATTHTRQDNARPLHEMLAISLRIAPGEEPTIVFEAAQPLFRLTREHVRQFAESLNEAKGLLAHLCPAPLHSDEESNLLCDAANERLDKHIHFVQRDVSSEYPAFLGFASLITVLDSIELELFEVDVFLCVQYMDDAEAVCFYAFSDVHKVAHLQEKGRRACRGPVLCGATPEPSPNFPYTGWFILPCLKEPGQDRRQLVCPLCLEQWKRTKFD